VLQVFFGTVGGLLVVPYAVNLDTGGTAPGWLRPHIGWLWPVALACVAAIIVLELADRLIGGPETISLLRPHDPRNVSLALAQVARYVDQRRRGQLSEHLMMFLAERPDAVRTPVHMVGRIGGGEFELSARRRVIDVYDDMDESMLILGAPGAGKTTQLLDLAGQLLARAERRRDAPIPVLFDLSDWARSSPRRRWPILRREEGHRAFLEWIVAELNGRYRIPPLVGRSWLRANRFVLLLDGLDEVPAELGAHCLRQINQMQLRFEARRLVVCSREADYERLVRTRRQAPAGFAESPDDRHLRLQGAVVIRPLTREQVTGFLAAVSPKLTPVAAALRQDARLWDLLTTPLMLTVLVLAQDAGNWTDIAAESDREKRRALVFDAYVAEVLARPRAREIAGPERTVTVLKLLATIAIRRGTGVVVARPRRADLGEWFGAAPLAAVRSRLAPIAFTAALLASAVVLASIGGHLTAAIAVVLTGPFLVAYPHPARPPARVAEAPAGRWLTRGSVALLTYSAAAVCGAFAAALMLPVLVAAVPGLGGAPVAVVVVALVGLIDCVLLVRSGAVAAFLVVPVLAVTFVLVMLITADLLDPVAAPCAGVGVLSVFGVVAVVCCEQTLRTPWLSRGPRTVRLGLVAALLIAAVAVSFLVSAPRPAPSLLAGLGGWALGVGLGFAPAFAFALALQVPAARLAMVVAGLPDPWRTGFLSFGADRSLLVGTGSEYRFVHLFVRDHLAACDPAALAAAVRKRRELLRLSESGDISVAAEG